MLDVPQPDLPEGDHDGIAVRYATRRGRDAADDLIRELVAETSRRDGGDVGPRTSARRRGRRRGGHRRGDVPRPTRRRRLLTPALSGPRSVRGACRGTPGDPRWRRCCATPRGERRRRRHRVVVPVPIARAPACARRWSAAPARRSHVPTPDASLEVTETMDPARRVQRRGVVGLGGEQHRSGDRPAQLTGQPLDWSSGRRRDRGGRRGCRTDCPVWRPAGRTPRRAAYRHRGRDRRPPPWSMIGRSVNPRNTATSVSANRPSSTPVRSAPALNAGGAPVKTSTRASTAWRWASSNPRRVAWSTALRRSGRSSVTTSTSPSRATRTTQRLYGWPSTRAAASRLCRGVGGGKVRRGHVGHLAVAVPRARAAGAPG